MRSGGSAASGGVGTDGAAAGGAIGGLGGLLGAQQVLSRFMRRGHVARQADDAIDLARFVRDWEAAVGDPARGAVGADQPVFLGDRAALHCLKESRSHAGLVVRMNGVDPVRGGRGGGSPDRLVGRTDVEDAARLPVHDPEDLVDAVGQLAEAFLTGGQLLLGLLPFGHVAAVADDAADRRHVQ